MNNPITRIKEKLTILKDSDPQRTIFGSSKHQYKLNTCLPIEQVRQFEATHNIQLPEEFITFYTTIGNSGAGPFYGLEPFENMLFSDLDYKREDNLLNPSAPFLHTQPWNMEFVSTVSQRENEVLYEKGREAFYDKYYANEQKHWSEKEAAAFVNWVSAILATIQRHPEMCRPSHKG
ncbi:SMI1/KNR4 family protein [Niabella drilacis]|uniref:SMI1 / KNR4 family (SUKH-1) n=1 Tax=Niabella drilacis (strain DSM 25811 / CCM 8410 / CCUG 62505 / LMG 26954 / E90) TaxID=1285928 RepID=A0A1G6I6I3_NIADE|nr:SMI1/KNR4 family protein [Niabella drilacis]SDC02050.1 hypothetical protein SAMN04487894_101111 [Niabella drilacis]